MNKPVSISDYGISNTECVSYKQLTRYKIHWHEHVTMETYMSSNLPFEHIYQYQSRFKQSVFNERVVKPYLQIFIGNRNDNPGGEKLNHK